MRDRYLAEIAEPFEMPVRPFSVGEGNVRVRMVLGARAVDDLEIGTASDVDRAERDAAAAKPAPIALPKGVRLAHWGLLKNCHDIGERQHLTENDVLLLPISLFWSFGCSNGMMAALTLRTGHISPAWSKALDLP